MFCLLQLLTCNHLLCKGVNNKNMSEHKKLVDVLACYWRIKNITTFIIYNSLTPT